jgi:hypothetical protein
MMTGKAEGGKRKAKAEGGKRNVKAEGERLLTNNTRRLFLYVLIVFQIVIIIDHINSINRLLQVYLRKES